MTRKSKSGYLKKIISIEEKERLYKKYISSIIFERKANISGGCLHLYSDNTEWKNQWDENWYFIDENIRSHAKIYSVKSGSNAKGIPIVKYDPISRTVFFENNDYYGWLKSVALALMGDVFEDNHNIFSCHGALLSIDNKGVVLIGPSGTGKTTLSYGLLTQNRAKIIADDWYYFKFVNKCARGFRSEKNTYIRGDLSKSWKKYRNVMKHAKVDNKGRAIVNIAFAIGRDKVADDTDIHKIVILRREKSKPVIEKLSPEQAINHLIKNDFFNPHIIHHNGWKTKVRKNAFMKLIEQCDIILLNTTETPRESLSRIMRFIRE